MDLQLEGRVALVTGSYRGTGSGIARTLAREGVRVLVHGFTAGQADAVTAEIQAECGDDAALAVTADLLDRTEVEALAAAISADPGRLDILVNNYGFGMQGKWDNTSDDAWHEAYDRNVLTASRCIQVFRALVSRSDAGRIIQLGTVGSTRPNAIMPHYYAAKGALATMTVSLAQEMAGTGVTVNLVSPGLIDTPEVRAAYTKAGKRHGWGDSWEEVEPALVKDRFPNPVGRIARVEEVADIVAFLASPRAGYIHGQNIRLDGGAVGVVN